MSDKDTIYRQDAIDALTAEANTEGAYGYVDVKTIVDCLTSMSSAEPRKRGKWIEHHEPYTWMGDTYWTCSKCNFGEKEENKERSNFCPDCGVDMREGEEE